MNAKIPFQITGTKNKLLYLLAITNQPTRLIDIEEHIIEMQYLSLYKTTRECEQLGLIKKSKLGKEMVMELTKKGKKLNTHNIEQPYPNQINSIVLAQLLSERKAALSPHQILCAAFEKSKRTKQAQNAISASAGQLIKKRLMQKIGRGKKTLYELNSDFKTSQLNEKKAIQNYCIDKPRVVKTANPPAPEKNREMFSFFAGITIERAAAEL